VSLNPTFARDNLLKTQDDINITGLTVSLPPELIGESSSRPHSLPNTSSFDNLFHSHKQHQKLRKQLSEYPYRQESEDVLEEEEVVEEEKKEGSHKELTRTGSSWKQWLWLERNNNTTPLPALPIEQKPIEEEKQVYLKRSLRPTSDQLKALNLHHGRNEVKFLVTSRILGTQEVTGYIYMWEYNSKIVISDVDGTITKYEILTHFTHIRQI
jgi:phosphatidate phosphatase PAH1